MIDADQCPTGPKTNLAGWLQSCSQDWINGFPIPQFTQANAQSILQPILGQNPVRGSDILLLPDNLGTSGVNHASFLFNSTASQGHFYWPGAIYPLAGTTYNGGISQTVVGDYNGDGLTDLAILFWYEGNSYAEVTVWMADAESKSFQPGPLDSQNWEFGAPLAPDVKFVGGNFDGIGYDDIIALNPNGQQLIAMMSSTGKGTFSPAWFWGKTIRAEWVQLEFGGKRLPQWLFQHR